MLNQERKNAIMDILKTRGTASVQMLTKVLNASESTIRRDIAELAGTGLVSKIHGGAMLKSQNFIAMEDSVQTKSGVHVAEKKAIARYAASQINSDDFVYLDAGTTTYLLIDYLDKNCKASFVTNGISHAKHLVGRGFPVYMLGGQLKSTTEAVIGVVAAKNIRTYNFTKAFMGTNGITPEQGYSTPDAEEAFVKAAAFERSFVTYVLADSSKFGRVSSVTYAPIDRGCIITDELPDESWRKYTVIKTVGKDEDA